MLDKHDVEYSEGVFLGMSGMGSEIFFGTPEGGIRTREIVYPQTKRPDGTAPLR